jgi:hypothetical protein
MEGTPYSAVTDSAGNWTMKDLPTGAYNIVYSKDGYDSYRVFGYQFVGGGDVYLTLPTSLPPTSYVILYKSVADISVVGLNVARTQEIVQGIFGYYLDGRIIPATPGLMALIFVGHDSTVSSDPSTFIFSTHTTAFDASGHLPNDAALGSNSLYAAGFKKGEKAYVVAYVAFNTMDYYYLDPRCGCNIFMGRGHIRSNVVAIDLP